jgi:hypothetical protein
MRRTEEKIYELILHEQQRSPGASQNHSLAFSPFQVHVFQRSRRLFWPNCESLARVMTKFNQLSNSFRFIGFENASPFVGPYRSKSQMNLLFLLCIMCTQIMPNVKESLLNVLDVQQCQMSHLIFALNVIETKLCF